MAITRPDLKFFKSATVSDGGANGGRISASEIVSGSLSNLFPPVEDAERVAGSVKYRKWFPKVHEDGSSTGYAALVFMERPTAGEDAYSIFPASQTDTQASITGSEDRYAVGQLNANVDAGATEIEVEVEDGNQATFRAGGAVRVTNKTSLDDLGGTTEFRVIDDVVDVSGNIVTITLTVALANGYLASVTRVAAVYAPGNVAASVSDFELTSDDGELDDAQIELNNRGTIQQTWTGTFTNPTNFDIVGDTVGSVGSGTVGGGAAPNNPDWTKPYFTLPSEALSGTFEAGDVFVLTTSPAAVPMWAKRVVPADSAVAASNSSSVRFLVQA